MQGLENVGKVFLNPGLRIIFLVVFLLTFGFSIFTQFLQVFLFDKFSFNQSSIGDYFAFIGICIAVTQGFITRRFTNKLAPQTAVTIFTMVLAIGLALILVPDKVYLLYLLSPILAIGQGVVSPNIQTLVSDSADATEQGEIMGLNRSVQSLAQAIPPILAGYIVSISRNLPILTATFFTLLAWLVFVFYYNKKKGT